MGVTPFTLSAIMSAVQVSVSALVQAAGNNNKFATEKVQITGTRLTVISRVPVYLQAEAKAVYVSWYNWLFTIFGVTDISNSFDILKMSIEKDGAASSVPVTFGGLRNKTLLSGATDQVCDRIPASAFGLGSLPAGRYWLRIQVRVNTSGHYLPAGIPYTGNGGGSFPTSVGWQYDPTENPTVPDVDSVGNITLGNGAGAGLQKPPSPIFLAEFVTPQPTYAGIGDSIMEGANDLLTGNGFRGFFARTLATPALTGSRLGGINFGMSGSGPVMWQGAGMSKAIVYLKYCRHAITEHGTNVFLSGGSPSILNSLKSDTQTIWNILRSNGIVNIVATKILPRLSSSSDSVATVAGQVTLNSAFSIAGEAQQYNDWLDAQKTALTITDVSPFAALRDSTNTWAWVVNGTANYATTDLIHPTDALHNFAASELYSKVSSWVY
jgi:hypothetical protein